MGFTRTLMADVLIASELAGTTFAFTDINEKTLDGITQLARRDIEANKLPVRIVSTGDRREALAGADYVINTTRISGLEAFALEKSNLMC